MIERCMDYRRIKRVAPKWDLVVSSKIFYLMEVNEKGDDVGVIVFHPCEGGMLAHVHMTEECRGKQALKSYRQAFSWMFDNTDEDNLFGEIPEGSPAAYFMARHSGAKYNGTNDFGLRCYSIARLDFMQHAGAI